MIEFLQNLAIVILAVACTINAYHLHLLARRQR